ncbi:MAG TPA: Zn-dependent alcohol dehydrogenase [bacterium]|nr:Zn-dependent alcohol dehydrogenase [bacterium]
MKTKAAILYEPNAPLAVEQIELDPPGAGEMLVQMKATGICHSDLHCIQGDWPIPMPMVLGHEGAGVIKEVGAGVTRFQPGDHVILTFLPACGHCNWCHRGRPNLCDLGAQLLSGKLPGGETRMHTQGGDPLNHWLFVSTFAEYAVVPELSAVKVAPDVPLEKVCLLGCGATTGFGAAWRTVQVAPGDAVVVVGAGGLGLNTIQACALSGASKIIAIDVHEEKLVLAKKFGATHTIQNNHDIMGVLGQVMELTEGVGADYGFEVVGEHMEETVALAFNATAKGGTTVIVGVGRADAQGIAVSPFVLPLYAKTVKGTLFGNAQFKYDLGKLVGLYQEGKLNLDDLVSQELTLDQVNQGLDDMRAGNKVARSVIRFD